MIEREGRLMERRVWLQGQRTGRMALVLDYAQGGRGFESAWVPGHRYGCALNFYPGHAPLRAIAANGDRKSTRLNSSHSQISYAVFCLKKKKNSVCEQRSHERLR